MSEHTDAVKARRSELRLTQQEAAKRAGTSLATWRRFENWDEAGDPLNAFRADTTRGFARALKVDQNALRTLIAGSGDDSGDMDGTSTAVLDTETANTVKLFNKAFTGDPLTPVDAMALLQTVIGSPFAPTIDGKYHHDAGTSYEFAAYLRGEASIREVDLLCDLPDFVLTQVNNHWLIRMGERIMRIGNELDEGRTPRMACLADSYAAWIVISNTEVPDADEFDDIYPGLRGTADIFGHDVDADDPDEGPIRIEWIERIAGGLLPSDEDDDFRRYDLLLMEAYGQGIYDTADPRHPLRWFDLDANRGRYESEVAFVRLPKEDQEAHTAEVMRRLATMFSDED